jgi:uncharacterized protein YjiS (DUF1127 family)
MAHIHVLGTRTVPNFGYSRVADAVRSAWVRYWTRRAERATVLVLRSLDSRTLKDIGLHRSEIESVVYGRTGGNRASERRVTMCRPSR